jgi:hypothetical protein
MTWKNNGWADILLISYCGGEKRSTVVVVVVVVF